MALWPSACVSPTSLGPMQGAATSVGASTIGPTLAKAVPLTHQPSLADARAALGGWEELGGGRVGQ